MRLDKGIPTDQWKNNLDFITDRVIGHKNLLSDNQKKLLSVTALYARNNAIMLEGYDKILALLDSPGNIEKKEVRGILIETLNQITQPLNP